MEARKKTKYPVHSCGCLVPLTAPSTIEELNQVLIGILKELYADANVFVYKGTYREGKHSNELMASSGIADGDDPDAYKHALVQPVYYEHTQKQIANIVIRSKTPLEIHPIVQHVVQVYENQTMHINHSTLDKLTGLLTRDLFEFYIHRIYSELHQEKRRGIDRSSQYALAFLDIDDFKHINDRYGHLIGDEVLLLISQLMKTTFRSGDLLFRFGGEEFVVILSNCNLKICKQVLRRFGEKIESFSFPQVDHLTISIGYAMIDRNQHYGIILDRADKALYYVKEHGKNDCQNYEELVDKGQIEPLKKLEGDVELF